MARRDAGTVHPLLDWNSLTEKFDWPEIPAATSEPELISELEPESNSEVTIDDAPLIYFTLYQTTGVPGQDTALRLLPVWQFDTLYYAALYVSRMCAFLDGACDTAIYTDVLPRDITGFVR